MALALARAWESVEPVLRCLEHLREPLELGAGPEAEAESFASTADLVLAAIDG